jgi:hypothetical protein
LEATGSGSNPKIQLLPHQYMEKESTCRTEKKHRPQVGLGSPAELKYELLLKKNITSHYFHAIAIVYSASTSNSSFISIF